MNAYFMRAFGTSTNSPAVSQDNADALNMIGLVYLMESFDAIDESVVECWIGACKFSDGYCETFDRRRAIRMFRLQHRLREACIAGDISYASSTSRTPLNQLPETQQADISVTQLWLLNRLWNLCSSHGLLREVSDHPELRFDFAYHIASTLVDTCDSLSLSAMEVHGVGFVEKVYDIALGVCMAIEASTELTLDSCLTRSDLLMGESRGNIASVRDLLQAIDKLMRKFRGGNHEYTLKFATALRGIPGYYALDPIYNPTACP